MNDRNKGTPTMFEYAAYGMGGIFINLGIIAEQFGMYFMTNVALLPSAVVGSMMMITTLFDAINDPIIGGMADRCNTRIGKYRPLILGGAFAMCVTMIMRFTIPDLGETGKVIYYMIAMLLYSVAFTTCCVPWQAMMSILSVDYKGRNVLLTVRLIAGALVGTVIGAVLLKAVDHFGGGADGWQNFILMIWCIGLPAAFLCQLGMKRVDYKGSIPTPPKKSVSKQMLQLTKNKPVVCVCLAIGLTSLTQTINNASSMYYYEYVLGDTSVLMKTSVYSLPVSLICTFSIPFILEKIDKRHMLLIAYVLNMVKPITIWLMGDSLTVDAATALIVFSYIGAAFYGSSIFAWVPECVDWTNWRYKISAAGIISASVTFMQKVGRAFGQWMTGALMGFAGFHADGPLTQEVTDVILNLNGLFQVIGFTLTLIPILLFPISRVQGDEIRQKLRDREREDTMKVSEPWHPGP